MVLSKSSQASSAHLPPLSPRSEPFPIIHNYGRIVEGMDLLAQASKSRAKPEFQAVILSGLGSQ